MREYNAEMKISAIRRDARESLLNEIIEFLKGKGYEMAQVKSNEVGVVIGTYEDEDKFLHDVVDVVKVTSKPFYSKEATTEEGRDVVEYDLLTEAEDYEIEKNSKKNSKKNKKSESND